MRQPAELVAYGGCAAANDDVVLPANNAAQEDVPAALPILPQPLHFPSITRGCTICTCFLQFQVKHLT